jgi:type VI secretion system secreted protein VgrG
VTSAYNAAMAKTNKAPRAKYYEPLTTLRMSNSDVDAKLESSMRSTQTELSNLFPGFDNFPAEAQLGLMDMGFNLGASNLPKKFPNFTKAVRLGDWATAAKQSNRPQLPSSRNQQVRKLFEAAAQAANPANVGSQGGASPSQVAPYNAP